MNRFRQLLLLPLLLILVACGAKTAKDDFIGRIQNNQSAKQVAYQYTFRIDDVVTAEAANNPVLSALVGQELTLNINQDLDKHLVSLSTDLSAINPGFSSFEFIYADDKAYMTAAPMLAMSGLDTKEFEGKFIDIEQSSGQNLPNLSQFSPSDYQNTELYKNLDAKYFTKTGDDVTLKLTLAELFDLAQKTIAKTDKVSAEEFASQTKVVTQQFSNKSHTEITLDKEGNGKAKIHLLSAANDKESLTLAFDFKKVAYKAPKLPSEENILSQDELTASLSSNFTTELILSEEEFDSLYAGLEAEISNYSQENLQQMIDALRPSLTPEQIQKLESLLPKAKATN